jgi:hypothetical protein
MEFKEIGVDNGQDKFEIPSLHKSPQMIKNFLSYLNFSIMPKYKNSSLPGHKKTRH